MYNFDYLFWIDLNITDLCNLRCSFCPRADKTMWPNNNIHMDLDLIKKITDDLIEKRYRQQLSFTGRGESTLHNRWDEAFEILVRKDRTYLANVTTNGRKLEKLWPQLRRLDRLVCNTYVPESDGGKEIWEERKAKFPTLDNGHPVKHEFKPDSGGGLQMMKDMGRNFNNRAGMFDSAQESEFPLKKACLHPIQGIFINFDGTYELCCNDWNYKTKIDSVKDKNILDIYMQNPELNRIRYRLLKEDRTCTKACSECDKNVFNGNLMKTVLSNPPLIRRLQRYDSVD